MEQSGQFKQFIHIQSVSSIEYLDILQDAQYTCNKMYQVYDRYLVSSMAPDHLASAGGRWPNLVVNQMEIAAMEQINQSISVTLHSLSDMSD